MRAPSSYKVSSVEWLKDKESKTLAGNPWTESQLQARDERYATLAACQPEWQEKLGDFLRENQNFIAVGDAGTGKTIQHLVHTSRLPILLGLGRRLQAAAAAEDLQVCLGIDPKDTAQQDIIVLRNGISNRPTKAHVTRIVVVTEGILYRECLRNPSLDRYSAVILDQVQDASGLMEALFAFTGQLMALKTRVRFGFIGSSYDVPLLQNSLNLPPQSLLTFPDRTFPLHIKYPPESIAILGLWVVQRLAAFISRMPGDVIIFASGQSECEEYQGRIRAANLSEPLAISIISSSASADDRRRATCCRSPNAKRRVIISTTILQSGITIPGLALVIDPLVARPAFFDAEGDRRQPVTEPVSSSTADQRAGCVGRLQEGHVERASPKAVYAKSRPYSKPKLLHEDYTDTLLANLALTQALQKWYPAAGIPGNLLKLRHEVPQDLQDHAVFVLDSLDAIDISRANTPDGIDIGRISLTHVGSRMAGLSTSPEYARSLIASVDFGCVDHMIILIAANSSPQSFFAPFRDIKKSPKIVEAQQQLMAPEEGDDGDHYPAFNALLQCWRAEKSFHFGKHNGLQMAAVSEASEVCSALSYQMGRSIEDRTKALPKEPDFDAMLQSMVYGHLHMIAEKSGPGMYRRWTDARSNLVASRQSRLYQNNHDFLLFSDARKSDDQPELTVVNKISGIDPSWVHHAQQDIWTTQNARIAANSA